MKVTQTYLNQLAPALSERDLEIIHEVGRFKLITGGQLERLFFVHCSDRSRARNRQAVLRRLTNHQVLTRVAERRIGGAARGSASYVYALDIAGQHLAQLSSTRPRRPYVFYDPTIQHFLAVAELYVQLVEAARVGTLLAVAKYEPEPYCWRSFGSRTLKPDAFVQLGAERGGQRFRVSLFIEVDRAGQFGTKIASKIPQYLDYYQHERFTGAGRTFPRIVFLAPHEQRVGYLTRLLNEWPDSRQLFSVGLLEDPLPTLLSP